MPVDASGDQVVLRSGHVTLTVVTVGGGMRELRVGDWHVLDGYGPDEVPVGAYGQPLIPWPNRLAGGRYEFAGEAYQVPLTEPSKNNALHGFTRWMTWDVVECDAASARLALLLPPRQGYPFALRSEIEYRVSQSAVNVVVTAVNAGRKPLPYANGFHPYVSVGAPKIDDCVLKIPAATWYPTDEWQIPVGREPVEDTQYDFRRPMRIGSVRLDTAFTDLERDADGMARVELASGDGSRRVAVRLDQAYRYVMAFTGDTLADERRRRRSLGVEPMTAAPNAFQSKDGLGVLEPQATFRSEWGIEFG